MISKALPLIIMTTGVVANADKIKGMIGHAGTVAVQSEVNEITHLMVLDQISGEKLPQTPEELAVYLRKNMRLQNGAATSTRDPSKDQFGTDYQVAYVDSGVKITSAGPDKTFETSDDIYSKRQF